MSSMTFTLTGDVAVSVTVTELADGTLQFDLAVLDNTGSIGDLNGLFFDLADDSLAGSLSVAGDDVTGSAFKADAVTRVDSWNNVNGEVAKDLGKFDGGVQFGTSGIGEDDIRETSFVLSSDTGALSLDMFASQDFAVRLTSVGEEGGTRDDSYKIGGTAPDAPVDPDPEVHIANDDTINVFEDASFDGFEFLQFGNTSVLDNDTTDGGAYTGLVHGADGTALDAPVVLAGSNGGLLMIHPDGSVDFSANGAFDYLNDFENAVTQFTYAVEGGDTAVVTVNVAGMGGLDGGGGLDGDLGLG